MPKKTVLFKSTDRPTQSGWPSLARVVQVNLGLSDAISLDIDGLVADLIALGANGVVFNTGGVYTWYPTELTHHGRNPYLADRDLVAEMAGSAGAQGLSFIGRYDFSLIEAPLVEGRWDWLALGGDGEPLEIGEPRTDGLPALLATAMTGGYRRHVASDIIREAQGRTPLDAVFFNAPEPFPDCRSGTPQPSDPKQAEAAFFENWELWRNTVKQVDPECRILGRFNAFQYRSLRRLAATCDVLTSQPLDWLDGGVSDQRPPWFAALTTKVGRRAMANQPPLVIIHAAPGLSWRHVGLPRAEARMWLAQVLANGGELWQTLTGLPSGQADRRMLEDVAWANRCAEAAEPWLTNTRSVASIGVVVPRRWHEHADHTEAAGIVDALTMGRRFYHPLNEEDLTPDGLKGLEVLVLPSVECISDDEANVIERFAQQGGRVIATFRTGWRDETGALRPTPALTELFGIASTGERVDDLYASYFDLLEETPLSRQLGDTELVAGQGPFQQVEPSSRVDVWAKLALPFAARGGVGKPPERVRKPEISKWPAVQSTGKAVYFAHAIGRLITRYGLPDHRKLIFAALDHLAERQRVRVEAPTGVHASLFERGDRLLLHLLNAVGQRPLSDCVPIHDIGISADVTGMRTVPQGIDLKRQTNGCFVLEKLDVWQMIELRP